jgi:EAL domain-containing protein (putative c-di-GMP-specific phosphodiesterase class I)
LPGLQDAGIAYIKVDARHLRGVSGNEAVYGYAQSLVALIHGLGLTALAEGIDDERDLDTLWGLGFDGATGPAVEAQVDEAPVSVS